MKLTRYDDIHQFRAETLDYLLQREAERNLFFGISNDIATTTIYDDYPPYLATIRDTDRIVAVALRTPPHNLHITRATPEALDLLVADVADIFPDLPGATGPKDTSRTFAEKWTAHIGYEHRKGFAQRIYQLDEVIPVAGVAGEMRQARPEDVELAVEWWMGFEADAFDDSDRARAERAIQYRMSAEGRGLFLWWHDRQPVSIAGYGGWTPNGIRIGPVYTPPEFRRRGYGTALTAALSQYLLDSGRRFCFLFTDLNNPTSNSIYQRIGYRPVTDVDEYRFEGLGKRD